MGELGGVEAVKVGGRGDVVIYMQGLSTVGPSKRGPKRRQGGVGTTPLWGWKITELSTHKG